MLKQHWGTKQREALSGAIKTKGYLHKKSNSLISNYQKRFFIINNDYLVYYKDQSLDSLKNKISLNAITDIKSLNQCEFTFYNKQKNKKYQIKASNSTQRDQWVSSLIVIEQYLILSNRKTLIEMKPKQEETKFQSNIRTILTCLGLDELSKQYHEDYIKCRIIGHLTTKGCLFLISCKSLVNEIKDQIILDKEYVYPKQFNVLYLHDPKTNSCERIINAQEIKEIVLVARTLRINNIRLNIEEEENDLQFTQRFIDRLKLAAKIGKQYRNSKGIVLRQNIDYLVDLFHKQSDRLQKQHIQIKLQDQYIGIIVNNHRDYKRNFDKFKVLIKQIRTQIQDTLNAIELKEESLRELSILYVNFYYQKIYKLLQMFWTQNYDLMKVGDIICLTVISINFNNTVSKYVSDGSLLVNGAKLLRDIYLKKILTEIENNLKVLVKNWQFKIGQIYTYLPYQFTQIIKCQYKIIEQNCQCQDTKVQSQLLLLEGAILLLTNLLENKIELLKSQKQVLIILCNDIWKYKQKLKQLIPKQQLSEIYSTFDKFQRNIIRKIYTLYLSQQPVQYSIKQIQFLKLSIEKYTNYAKKQFQKLQNLDSKTKQQIQNRMGQNFNTYYFRCLMKQLSKTVIFKSSIEEIICKIKDDCLKLKSIFSKQNVQIVSCLLINLILLLEQQNDDDKIKLIYCQLRQIIINEQFRQNDMIILIKINNTRSKQNTQKLIQQLENPMNYQQNNLEDIQNDNSSNGSKVSLLRINRQISQKDQVQLLLNNNISLEGYLKIKNVQIHNPANQYHLEYFKLTSECLLWFNNPKSQGLEGRIFLIDIKEVYLNPKSPSKFYIDLKNNLRYKFRTNSIDTAIKWVEHINISSFKPKAVDSKIIQLKNIPEQQIFNNYFQQIQKEKDMQSRLSNVRDYKPSKLTTKESSSVSPVKKVNKTPDKRKFGLNKKFGCVNLP